MAIDLLHSRAYINSRRLYRDSRKLLLIGSVLSAASSAILAIEELGKSLILTWGVRNKGSKRANPSHIEKQSATFALLAANELMKPRARAVIAQWAQSGEQADFNKLGGYCEQLAFARAGFYEDLRMTLSYEDETPPLPVIDKKEQIKSALVRDLHATYRDAVKLRDKKRPMELASEIYKTDLGRL